MADFLWHRRGTTHPGALVQVQVQVQCNQCFKYCFVQDTTTSKHPITTLKKAYLKLRYLVRDLLSSSTAGPAFGVDRYSLY